MSGFWSKSRSLKQLLLLSWIAPALLTLVASLAVFLFLGWLDYQNGIDVTSVGLKEKSKVAARRVSAELLLQEHGAVGSVLQKLQEELDLGDLQISGDAHCGDAGPVCSQVLKSDVEVARKIPQMSPVQYIVLRQGIQPFQSFLNPKFLAWSALPVFFLIAVGLFIQLVFLQKKVINPIGALVGAGDANFSVRDQWPVEVRQIGGELKASFEAKEQAVFALLAKGVIHDIKTFMHSLLIATDMIGESADEAKRVRRLENLYKASKSNLPKIKRIIELTLDGSRDIPIREVESDVLATIKGAIAANADYAQEKAVTIRLEGSEKMLVTHDPVQLERALANLIRNGVEVFSDRNVEGETKREVLVSVSEVDQQTVSISVEDTGSGYSGEAEQFMPMKSAKAHGAGLGLYITNKIIQGHRGSLKVMRSVALGGARFCVSIPRGGAQ